MISTRPRGPRSEKFDPNCILAAAQEVFATQGIHGASIRSIAKQAGCDSALIYYHFESKEGIFTALIDRKFPLIQQELFSIFRNDSMHIARALWEVLGVYQRHMANDAGFRAMIRGEMVRGAEGMKDALSKRIQPISIELMKLIERGIQAGLVRPDVVPMFTVFFLIRMELEILDLVPTMGERLSGLPPQKALPLMQRHWFDTLWRGIAVRPNETLPFDLVNPI